MFHSPTFFSSFSAKALTSHNCFNNPGILAPGAQMLGAGEERLAL
jgi:hypothetical protein